MHGRPLSVQLSVGSFRLSRLKCTEWPTTAGAKSGEELPLGSTYPTTHYLSVLTPTISQAVLDGEELITAFAVETAGGCRCDLRKVAKFRSGRHGRQRFVPNAPGALPGEPGERGGSKVEGWVSPRWCGRHLSLANWYGVEVNAMSHCYTEAKQQFASRTRQRTFASTSSSRESRVIRAVGPRASLAERH